MRKKIYLPSTQHSLEEYDIVYHQQDILNYIADTKKYPIFLPKSYDDLQTDFSVEQKKFKENLANTLSEEEIFLRCICSDDFIKNYFYNFYNMPPANYLKAHCTIPTISFDKMLSLLNEENKYQMIAFLSMVELQYQSYISLHEIKESIHHQIHRFKKDCEKNLLMEYPLEDYEQLFLEQIKESYIEMYKKAQQNQKVLNLKK